MGLFTRVPADDSLPKDDRGQGSMNDYVGVLVPRKKSIVLRLADSNPHQGELRRILDSGEETLETGGGRRSPEDERADAAMPLRLFSGGRVTAVVGTVPRGFEGVIEEALTRLERSGKSPRIPARVVSTRAGLRIDILVGLTR